MEYSGNRLALLSRTPVMTTTPAGFDAVLSSARRDVLVVGAAGILREDHLRRGVRYRVLLPDSARTSTPPALARAGVALRTVPRVPVNSVVVDNLLVVHPGPDGATVIRLPGVLATTVELFERMWVTGAPLTASGCRR